ncbi:M56 family metallopeptidase [Luteolibacter soli]|uniref:M56 family metallopeptidase n=1 Tax=Luteolibacter soli TaxID=3135280 RepID=A0ABU9AZZ1_9BACT
MNLLETVFEWVVSTTIRASLVAVAILAIQMMLRPWLPAKWRHPLWLPLLLVMVLPFVPALPVHLIPARHATPPAAAPVTLQASPANTGAEQAPVATTTAIASNNVALLPTLWLAGLLITMTAGITGYRLKLTSIRTHALTPDPDLQEEIEAASKAAGLSKAPLVWLSREVESPAVSGLLRPVLLLPAGFSATFTATETRLILLHEFSHIKRHDLAQNWLLFALQSLHWFNPVIWFAFARLRQDRETACDARVLALDSQDRRSEYGHALLKMQELPAVPGLRLGFVGLFENLSGLRSRISDVARYRRSHPAWQVTGSLLVATIALFGSTRAQEKTTAGNEEKTTPTPKKEDAPPMTPGQAYISKKLDTIIIPLASFDDTSLEESIDFIRIRSVQLDEGEKDPTKKGINFVIRKARGADGQETWTPNRSTLQLKNVSLRRLLEEVAEQSGTKMKIDDFAITLIPKGEVDRPADPPAPRPEPLKGKAADAAQEIIIPVVDVEDVTLTEMVDFLNKRSKELAGTKAPAINIGPGTKGDTRIKELRLKNVPLVEAARYVAESTKNQLSADDTSIQIGK